MTYYSEKITLKKHLKNKMYRLYFTNSGKIIDLGCSKGLLLQHDIKNIIGLDRDLDGLKQSRSLGADVIMGDLINNLPTKKRPLMPLTWIMLSSIFHCKNGNVTNLNQTKFKDRRKIGFKIL